MEGLVQILPLVAILLLFWLFIIRPAQRRAREQREMQASLEVGQEAMLTSGIYCLLREVAEDRVRVEVAEGVTITVARAAIGAVMPAPSEPTEQSEPTEPSGLNLSKTEDLPEGGEN